MAAVSGLGYVGASITDHSAWQRVLETVYALERRSDSAPGVHQYRLDDHHHRLALYEDDKDALSYVGWQVDSREELAALAARLNDNGVDVERGDGALCEQRAVMDLIAFAAPDGVRTELFFGPKQDAAPYSPGRGMAGFNTGKLGLGHIVLATDDPDATVKWYRDMLGFRLSDYIYWDDIEATFLHCNPRHHSLAFTNPIGPLKAGDLNHIMFESKSIDDVGRAYDIVHQHGFPIAMTLGRHTNDLTTSFYLYTPSGWWIEYGYGGRLIDDAMWEPKFYNAPKIWGHNLQAPPS